MCLLGLLRLPVLHFELLLGRVLIGFSTLRLAEVCQGEIYLELMYLQLLKDLGSLVWA